MAFPRFAGGLLVALLGTTLMVGAAGCAEAADGEETGEGTQFLSEEANAERVVRAYYAATKTRDPAAALAPIVDDGAILAAPSVKMLRGVPQVEGKAAFIKAVAGGAFLIGNATVREVIARGGDLVVARIDLPLPNGDVLTQVEFFEIKSGKIARMDSYYDSIRFAKALPAIALDRLKASLGL